MSSKPLAQESIPAGEAGFIEDLARRLKAKIIADNPTGIMRRDAHSKMHGIVRAEFIVEDGLPAPLRVGLFREPRTFPAWIRYSNADGGIQPDIQRAIRGMAIKVMGVQGVKLLDAEKYAETQDFLLISTNVFLTRDIEEFDGLTKALTGSTVAKLLFLVTHLRTLWNIIKSMKTFANPLHIRYWSTTPYLCGELAVKYSAMPRIFKADAIPSEPSDNYLSDAMARQLEQGDAWFDFMVQRQTDAHRMPIEDARSEWDETESPFLKVASIRILRQQFGDADQKAFGENLSFTPWHSLPEHRPLGGINRGRKMVYDVISAFRHDRNQAPRIEPTNWDQR